MRQRWQYAQSVFHHVFLPCCFCNIVCLSFLSFQKNLCVTQVTKGIRQQYNKAMIRGVKIKDSIIENTTPPAKPAVSRMKGILLCKVNWHNINDLYPKSLELQLGGKGTQPHELSCTK
jgi:hypothetical protein